MGIEVRGLDETIEQLNELAERMEDMTPAMQACAVEIKQFVDARFLTRTGPDGSAWAPLKRPSESTGTMQSSVYVAPESQGLSFGATANHADEQQLGTRRMPARPYLPTPQFTTGPAAEMWDRVRKIIRRYIAVNEPTPDGPEDGGFGDFNF